MLTKYFRDIQNYITITNVLGEKKPPPKPQLFSNQSEEKL